MTVSVVGKSVIELRNSYEVNLTRRMHHATDDKTTYSAGSQMQTGTLLHTEMAN